MRTRYLLCLTLVVMLAMSGVAGATTVTRSVYEEKLLTAFTDIDPNHWAFQDVAFGYNAGWFRGYPDRTFRMDGHITGEEYLAVILRFLGLAEHGQLPAGFTASPWAAAVVARAAALGLVSPFDATRKITREHAADILARALNLAALSASEADQILGRFTDSAEISAAYRGRVAALVKLGIFGGFPGGLFKPKDFLTRAQTCSILRRSLAIVRR
ncbi:MAG: S-layer homology domain-containing protein [bacterium]|nr:S-layer homology domain-containing protein [bacterium]